MLCSALDDGEVRLSYGGGAYLFEADAVDLTFLIIAGLGVVQLFELAVGVYNARRVTKIQSQADRAEEKLDKVLTMVPKTLRSGVDPSDAVAVREAKKLAATIDAAETEAGIIAEYGEIALTVKSLMGDRWDAAMRGGAGAALRLLKPFLARAQEPAQNNNTNLAGWR